MSDEKKLYTVQGTVSGVYGPTPVKASKGGKSFTSQKTDVQMETPKGKKVKVTFWNQAVPEDLRGGEISITLLKYTGVYKETSQFGSTKESKIHVIKGGPTEADVPGEPEDSPDVEEPNVDDEGLPSEEVKDDEPEPAPKAKRGRKPKAEASAPAVGVGAVALVTELVKATWLIVDSTADPLVQKDPVALQAYFATVFIALGKENYFDKK